MRRTLAALLGFYFALALSTRVAERVGTLRCGCGPDCWCKKPVLRTFRYVMPLGHRGP